jgi:hypothetical protein
MTCHCNAQRALLDGDASLGAMSSTIAEGGMSRQWLLNVHCCVQMDK